MNGVLNSSQIYDKQSMRSKGCPPFFLKFFLHFPNLCKMEHEWNELGGLERIFSAKSSAQP